MKVAVQKPSIFGQSAKILGLFFGHLRHMVPALAWVRGPKELGATITETPTLSLSYSSSLSSSASPTGTRSPTESRTFLATPTLNATETLSRSLETSLSATATQTTSLTYTLTISACDFMPCRNRGCLRHGKCVCFRSPETGYWDGPSCNQCALGWTGAFCDLMTALLRLQFRADLRTWDSGAADRLQGQLSQITGLPESSIDVLNASFLFANASAALRGAVDVHFVGLAPAAEQSVEQVLITAITEDSPSLPGVGVDALGLVNSSSGEVVWFPVPTTGIVCGDPYPVSCPEYPLYIIIIVCAVVGILLCFCIGFLCAWWWRTRSRASRVVTLA
eukprot:RCo004358